MKIKSGIFLLSVGLCITVGNMAQAAGTREGVASEFDHDSHNPYLGSAQGVPQTPLLEFKVQCPKNGFLAARADVLFIFNTPAKLPGSSSVRFGITRDDEEKAAFDTTTLPTTVPFRLISVPFSKGLEELINPELPDLTGSIQRVDRCKEGDEFSYAFKVFIGGSTADANELIVTVVEPVLVVEFFEKSIQVK